MLNAYVTLSRKGLVFCWFYQKKSHRYLPVINGFNIAVVWQKSIHIFLTWQRHHLLGRAILVFPGVFHFIKTMLLDLQKEASRYSMTQQNSNLATKWERITLCVEEGGKLCGYSLDDIISWISLVYICLRC